MAMKRKKSATTKRSAARKRTPEVAAAEDKFTRDVLIRGDAAYLDSEGKLPLEATHEIVKTEKTETPKIQRRRFKLY
jgi:hypothetical protein